MYMIFRPQPLRQTQNGKLMRAPGWEILSAVAVNEINFAAFMYMCVAMGCESASPNLASLRGFGKFRGRPLAARVGWIINTEQRIRPLWRGARWAQVPPAAPKLCENCTQPPPAQINKQIRLLARRRSFPEVFRPVV
jgi:hypothetical protein